MDSRIKVREFLLGEITRHPSDIVTFASKKLKFARQTVHYHLKKLIESGEIIATGTKKGAKYFLKASKHVSFGMQVHPGLMEDKILDRYLKAKIEHFNENVRSILFYGFTEIFNNVIEHSNAKNVKVDFEVTDNNIFLEISDNGIGIFKKVQTALNLKDPRDAVLELSKGKFTTNKERHTGEGIFFTSRIFDKCVISANNLIYTRFGEEDYFLESSKTVCGTSVSLTILYNSTKQIAELFRKYSDEESFEFSKTEVAVSLASKSENDWISRSQARRILTGLDKFSVISLDFKGVRRVGQAFVDEVFRVFKRAYPHIEIRYKNANSDVDFMIKRGIAM